MKKIWVWAAAVVVIMLFVLGSVCFSARNDNISEIMEEKNYRIVQQEMTGISLLISKDLFSEEAYTSEGQTFSEDEVIVYQTDTTSIYLEKVMLSNESDEQLYFIFNCTYHLPKGKDPCVVQVPYDKQAQGYRSALFLVNDVLSDDKTSYSDAVALRGSGPAAQFAFYVSKEACQKAVGTMKIDVHINQAALEPKENAGLRFVIYAK